MMSNSNSAPSLCTTPFRAWVARIVMLLTCAYFGYADMNYCSGSFEMSENRVSTEHGWPFVHRQVEGNMFRAELGTNYHFSTVYPYAITANVVFIFGYTGVSLLLTFWQRSTKLSIRDCLLGVTLLAVSLRVIMAGYGAELLYAVTMTAVPLAIWFLTLHAFTLQRIKKAPGSRKS